MQKRDILKTLPEDQKEMGARLFDKVELAFKRYQPVFTDFLDPGQQAFSMRAVKNVYGLSFEFIGGFEGAERKRMAIFPDDIEGVEMPECICCLEVTGNFRFQKVSHRDFLGGILGTGVKREKLGDLLITETGCQMIAATEIKEFLLHNLSKIHHVPVKVNEITVDQLQIEDRPVKEINTTVSSLRLDVISGTGYGLSRSNIAKYIAAEKVKVNWEVKTNADYTVKEGDVISVRGFGRMKVEQVNGETRKGRIRLMLTRYL